jgi:hypothetical protein
MKKGKERRVSEEDKKLKLPTWEVFGKSKRTMVVSLEGAKGQIATRTS